jgi:ribose-phosphate pyrophosphokinase
MAATNRCSQDFSMEKEQRLTIVAGSGNRPLAESIAERLGVGICRSVVTRFPDSELYVELDDSVRDRDVYIVQSTGPAVDGHLMELLLLADAGRRAGAARLTAVVPYFGYARQDRRAKGREAVAGRVIADLLGVAGFERVVAVDLHTPSLEGFFSVPLEHLSAAAVLCNAIDASMTDDAVIIAPDLGAVKLAENYAQLLHLPIAIVHKTRISGSDVSVRGIVGTVAGRSPVIIDDMISTAGTIEAAVKALLAAGCRHEITVAASHALLVGPAIERLSALALKRLIVTDSLPLPERCSLPIETVTLAPMLAETIARLNVGESMKELLSHR